jgi:hypothetical protein
MGANPLEVVVQVDWGVTDTSHTPFSASAQPAPPAALPTQSPRTAPTRSRLCWKIASQSPCLNQPRCTNMMVHAHAHQPSSQALHRL